MGLPFAVPFFLGCDGAMASLLGISPSIQKIPWQFNAKEVVNHFAWTLAAEAVHRLGSLPQSDFLKSCLRLRI